MKEIGKAAIALLNSLADPVCEPPEGWVCAEMAAHHWKIDVKTASKKLMDSGLQRRKCRSIGDAKSKYYYGPEPSQTNSQAHKAPSSRPISPTHDTKCRARKK